jgi:hypothetical protein
MKPNVVLAERTIRLGLGMLLLASPLLEFRTYPFNLLGLVLIVTAAVGYCPLYGLLSSFGLKSRSSSGGAPRSRARHESIQPKRAT